MESVGLPETFLQPPDTIPHTQNCKHVASTSGVGLVLTACGVTKLIPPYVEIDMGCKISW